MSTAPRTRTASGDIFVRGVVVVAGIGYLLTGLALMFAPEWFFQNIGLFPPFNRHYAGDLGMFQIPLGIGLLIAICNPVRHRGLIGVAAGRHPLLTGESCELTSREFINI